MSSVTAETMRLARVHAVRPCSFKTAKRVAKLDGN